MLPKRKLLPCVCSRASLSYALGILIIACIVISVVLIPSLTISKAAYVSIVGNEKIFLFYCSDIIRKRLSALESPLWEVGGLLFGLDLSLPPFNGSVNERIDGHFVDKFDFVVKRYMNLYPTFSTHIFLAPGGVVAQIEPFVESFYLQDLMLPNYTLNIDCVANSSTSLHQTRIILENTTTTSKKEMSWKVLQVYLLYQPTLSNTSGFWGLAGSWSDVSEAINENELLILAQSLKMEFLVAVFLTEGNLFLPVASSQGFNFTTPQSVLLDFLMSSQKIEFLMDDYLFYIFVRQKPSLKGFISLSRVPWVLLFILIGLITILSLLLGINLTLPLKIKAAYFYAPWKPPFAMLMIGSHKGERMLNLTADILNSARERVNHRFHACQVPHLNPYCSMYILESVKEAVEMGSAVLNALQSESLDFSHPLLTEEPPVLVLAIHWCQNVHVDRNFAEGLLVCHGPDIVYGTSLFNIGIGNSIILSSKAREKLGASNTFSNNIHKFSLPNRSREVFYFFVDSSSIEMVQAFISAQESLKESPLVECIPVIRDENKLKKMRSLNDIMLSYPVSAFPPLSEKNLSRNFDGSIQKSDEIKTFSLVFYPTSVPEWLDRTLRKIYEMHPLTPGPSHWLTVRNIIYYFYFGYALLFQPLAPRERRNITDCLARSFGVPSSRFYEHLAVHGALHFVQSIRNCYS